MSVTEIHRFDERREVFELGMRDVYKDTLKILPNRYKDWLEERPAAHFFDTDFGVSGLGTMAEKPVGTNPVTDRLYYLKTKTYTIKPYSLAVVAHYEVVRWDMYRVFTPVFKELAKTAVTRYDLVAYGLWNHAFDTTDSTFNNWNGEAICSTSHARADGGTWTNRPTTNVGLSTTGLQTIMEILATTVNHRGKFVLLEPKMLITTPRNDWQADILIKSENMPDNANRQYSPIRSYGLRKHISPYITTATNWFITCNKSDYRIAMGMGDSPDLQMDTQPGTRNRIFTSYCSFRMECFESFGIAGSPGS